MYRPAATSARPWARAVALLAGFGVAAIPAAAADRAREGMKARADLEVVECLLPGTVRQLGGRTSYLSQRRPIRTTASDCRIRGGEYVSYDRADYKSALRVWMESAQAGDAAAQTNVGEIYERGIGGEPNYEAALLWYGRAAEQGYSRALFNLGTLHEQGLGVERDRMAALNYYRQAWGVPEDNLIFASTAEREQERLRAELEQSIAERDQQLSLLQKQLKTLEADLAARARAAEADGEVQALRRWVAKLEAENRASRQRSASFSRTRAPADAAEGSAAPALSATVAPREAQGLSFGRYFALVIGNQDYEFLDSLQTPRSDAARAARLLRDKYGFSVQVLSDGNDVAMLEAVNRLREVVGDNDNVLIYYAGHGTRVRSGPTEVGYWMPVNAEPPPRDTYWIPNEQISAHLGLLKARRVLVVADSCYSGLLSADPSLLFTDSGARYSLDYVRFKLPKRSRLLLASGGDRPVLDVGGQGNSVFARAFLDELEANTGVLPSPVLFARVRDRVRSAAAENRFEQEPQLKSIRAAGHEVGDFFFVPK